MNNNLKRLLGMMCCGVLALNAFSQTSKEHIAIIPEPVSITQGEGQYVLPKTIIVATRVNPEMKEAIATLKSLSIPTGNHVTILNSAAKPAIKLTLNSNIDTVIWEEGYYL